MLVTGAIVTVSAEWLASPEGQKALNNGAKVIHEAVETVDEGVQAGIEAAKEFVGDVADAVSEAVDAVGNWFADTFGGGGSPNPNKPDDDIAKKLAENYKLSKSRYNDHILERHGPKSTTANCATF